jgi:hypothetical protein
MKIYEGQRILIEQKNDLNRKKNKGAESFRQVMEKVSSKSENSVNIPESINPVQIIDGVTGSLPLDSKAPVSGEKGILLDSLRDTLDLIDYYAGKLADKSFPVDNLSSLVGELQERLETMKGISSDDKIPDTLKPILADMTITLSTEIEKFKRGDYI